MMISAVISTLMSCQHTAKAEPERPTALVTEAVTAEPQYKTYTVKEYNGLVAVFYGDSTRPVRITDCYVSSLPE